MGRPPLLIHKPATHGNCPLLATQGWNQGNSGIQHDLDYLDGEGFDVTDKRIIDYCLECKLPKCYYR